MKFVLILFTFLATDCAGTDDLASQEVEKAALEKLAKEIKTIADSSTCSENEICAFIGFGSKPCGGNWEYLIYSSSIDVANFKTKVNTYNALEKKYNTKYEIISDCSLVMPPESLTCENGKCKAIKN